MTKKYPVRSEFVGKTIVTADCDTGRDFYNRSRYGDMKGPRVYLSLVEALFLVENNKLEVYNSRNKLIPFETLRKKCKKEEPNILVRYPVYRALREKGYIVKTALKFGADFRVYEKGIKPGEDHAKWVVYAVHESEKMTWFEFSAKNRVAHSTKKKLLIAIVDAEDSVIFYENGWIKP